MTQQPQSLSVITFQSKWNQSDKKHLYYMFIVAVFTSQETEAI